MNNVKTTFFLLSFTLCFFAVNKNIIKDQNNAATGEICEELAINCQGQILSYAQDLFDHEHSCASYGFANNLSPVFNLDPQAILAIDQVFIGCEPSNTDHILTVKDGIIAKALRVDLDVWPDYVFAEDYELLPLLDVKDYIEENGHLPGIPSGELIEAEGGFYLDDVTVWQQEKIEELFLYAIELEKEIDRLLEGK